MFGGSIKIKSSTIEYILHDHYVALSLKHLIWKHVFLNGESMHIRNNRHHYILVKFNRNGSQC